MEVIITAIVGIAIVGLILKSWVFVGVVSAILLIMGFMVWCLCGMVGI